MTENVCVTQEIEEVTILSKLNSSSTDGDFCHQGRDTEIAPKI
jgi:hypothetical protein